MRFILTAVLLASLVGCGPGNSDTGTPADQLTVHRATAACEPDPMEGWPFARFSGIPVGALVSFEICEATLGCQNALGWSRETEDGEMVFRCVAAEGAVYQDDDAEIHAVWLE